RELVDNQRQEARNSPEAAEKTDNEFGPGTAVAGVRAEKKQPNIVNCFTGGAATYKIVGITFFATTHEERLSPTVWTSSGSHSCAWHRWPGLNGSRLQSRAPDRQRDWRDWISGQDSVRRHVVLRGGVHPRFRVSRSRSSRSGRLLAVRCVPHRIHG